MKKAFVGRCLADQPHERRNQAQTTSSEYLPISIVGKLVVSVTTVAGALGQTSTLSNDLFHRQRRVWDEMHSLGDEVALVDQQRAVPLVLEIQHSVGDGVDLSIGAFARLKDL